MMRLIFTTWILTALVAVGFAQTDSSEKSSDSTEINTVQADSLKKSDSLRTTSHDSVITVTPPPRSVSTRPVSNEVYKLNLAVDIPLTAVTAAWSLYAFPKIYDKPW